MDRYYLEAYLHEQIPLSAAMKVSVRSITDQSVSLSAPLEPNINHKSTVFGGSASALGILSAWSTLHVQLLRAGLHCEIVIQSNTMEYELPIRGDFTATASLCDASDFPKFIKILMRRKKSRIEIQSIVSCDGTAVGTLRGRFVAFLLAAP